MACRLFGGKPLSKPTMTYHQYYPVEWYSISILPNSDVLFNKMMVDLSSVCSPPSLCDERWTNLAGHHPTALRAMRCNSKFEIFIFPMALYLLGGKLKTYFGKHIHMCARFLNTGPIKYDYTVYLVSLVNLRRSAPRLFALIWGINTPTRASPHPGLAVEGIYRRQFIVHSAGCLQGDMLNPCLCPTRRCWDMPLAPAMIRQPVSGHNEVDTQNTIYLLFSSLHGHILHIYTEQKTSIWQANMCKRSCKFNYRNANFLVFV